MQAAILDYLRNHDHVSFVELVRHLHCEGTYEIGGGGNVVYWGGVSLEFADAIGQLKSDKQIFFHPCNAIVYLIDGGWPRLPVVKRVPPPGGFKKPRWLPIVLRLVA